MYCTIPGDGVLCSKKYHTDRRIHLIHQGIDSIVLLEMRDFLDNGRILNARFYTKRTGSGRRYEVFSRDSGR